MIREPVIRITSDGSWRVTADPASGGAVRISELEKIEIPVFDIAATVDIWFPGIVAQRTLTDAVERWLIDNDGNITDADVPTILAEANALLAAEVGAPYVPTTQPPYPAALPPLPAPLPRFPDANPAPDGWSVVTDEKVVRGGP